MATQQAGVVTWIHSDHLSSAAVLTDADGTEIRRLAYAAFGEEAENSGPGETPTYTYTGKELDSSGFYYYGARYYDPALSRFITPDPLYDRGPQGLNRYTYALNNPIRYNDPTGYYISGPYDDENPTCNGCITGSGVDGGEDMVYHENDDDPSSLHYGSPHIHPAGSHRVGPVTGGGDVVMPPPGQVGVLHGETGDNIVNTTFIVADIIAGSVSDVYDIGSTGYRWTQGDFSYWDIAVLAPVISAGMVKYADEVIEGASKNSTALTGPFKGPYTKGIPAGTLDDISVRKWYLKQLDAIPGQIDRTQSLRNQARQAFELRNRARIDARALMSNRAKALGYDVNDPIRTWQGQIKYVVEVRGKSGSEIWEYILESSTRSRPSVNAAAGLAR